VSRWREARRAPPARPPAPLGPPLRRGPRPSPRPLWAVCCASTLCLWALWPPLSPNAPAEEGRARVASSAEPSAEPRAEPRADPRAEPRAEPSAEPSAEPRAASGADAAPPLDLAHPTLSWWIEGRSPTLEELRACLAALPGRPYSARLLAPGELEVAREGRARQQRLRVTAEQLWLHTPLSSTPLAQVHEHLSALSCLRRDGATLHDPLLARLWPSARWPALSAGGGAPLDDLLSVESEGERHLTRGLSRLGGAEQGLVSAHPLARRALRRLVVEWLASPLAPGARRAVGGVGLWLAPAEGAETFVGRPGAQLWSAEGASPPERLPDSLVERLAGSAPALKPRPAPRPAPRRSPRPAPDSPPLDSPPLDYR